jgi:hypothetical protein
MLRKTLRATPCSDCIRQFGSELRGKNKDRQRDTGTRGKDQWASGVSPFSMANGIDPLMVRCAVMVCVLCSSISAATQSTVPDKDTGPLNYYANAHPYLEEPLARLRKLIPELKELQPTPDQKELSMILQKTGQRVDDFTNNMVDLIARETVGQEARNWRSDLLGSQLVVDNYLTLVRNNGFITTIRESRLDLNGNVPKQTQGKEPGQGVFTPGYRVSSGFTSSTVYFATSQQPGSTFRYLGTERIGEEDTYVVAFAQRPNEATITTLWYGQGDYVHMLIQGIAWVDEETFQIIRLRTDLLAPRPDIRLVRSTTESTFSLARIPNVPRPLWLPSGVEEYIEQTDLQMRALKFRNSYVFTNYQRYLSNEKENSTDVDVKKSPKIYYGNARPTYLDEPPQYLAKLIPELKTIRPEADQEALPMILQKMGLQVDSFFSNIPNLIADEDITQQELGSVGEVNRAQNVADEYLILLHRNGNDAHLNEYRMDLKGNHLDEFSPVRQNAIRSPFFVTSGFALSCIHFSTALQLESSFRYLGEQRIGKQDTYVMAFAQGPDATTTVTMRGSGGTEVQMLVQGVAWVDKSSFQIMRLRTDLLLPRPEIGLDQQTTDVILSEVRLREITSPLWLPKVVNVYARFQGQNFKNEHHYANYRRYRVSTKVIF